jgi:hypothetical protein
VKCETQKFQIGVIEADNIKKISSFSLVHLSMSNHGEEAPIACELEPICGKLHIARTEYDSQVG